VEIAILPRRLLRRLIADDTRRLHLNVLLSSVLLLLLFLWLSHHPGLLYRLPHVCLVRHYLGIPCPGCGVTGSLLALARGNLTKAWYLHPAGALFGIFLGLQLPLRAVALWKRDLSRPVSAISRVLGGGILACLLLVWVYRVLH
jgi:hypothetical protein